MANLIVPSRFAQQPASEALAIDAGHWAAPRKVGEGLWLPGLVTRNLLTGVVPTLKNATVKLGVAGGPYGQAALSDGTEGYVTDATTVPGAVTLLAIVRGDSAPSTTGGSFPVYKDQYSIKWAAIAVAGVPQFFLHTIGGGFPSCSWGSVLASTWYVLGATWNGATMATYQNGVLQNTAAQSTGLDTTSTQGLIIANAFPGQVAYVLKLDRALSAAQIASLSRNPWQVLVQPQRDLWVRLSIPAALAGAAADVAATTGALSTGIQLTCAAAASSSAAGALTTAIRLAGAASDISSAAGALDSAIRLAGSAADVSLVAAALDTAIVLAGAATDLASASGTVAGIAAVLAGSASDSASATGALSTGIALAGAAQSVATSNSSLTTSVLLADAAAVAVSTTGALSTGIRLAVTATDTASATGMLSTAIRLSGAAVDTSSSSAAITTAIPLVGSAADSATSTGTLLTAIRLAGNAGDVVGSNGALTGIAGALAGSALDSVSLAGALTTGIPLAGTAISGVTSTASLVTSVLLADAAAVSVGASGALSTAIRLAGASTAQVSASAGINTAITLAGNAIAISTASGTLGAQASFAGVAAVAAVASGSLDTGIGLTGGVAAVVDVAGSITGSILLAEDAQVAVSATGALTTGIRLAGAASSQASSAGDLLTATIPAVLAGSVLSVVSASGDLIATSRITGGGRHTPAPAGYWRRIYLDGKPFDVPSDMVAELTHKWREARPVNKRAKPLRAAPKTIALRASDGEGKLIEQRIAPEPAALRLLSEFLASGPNAQAHPLDFAQFARDRQAFLDKQASEHLIELRNLRLRILLLAA